VVSQYESRRDKGLITRRIRTQRLGSLGVDCEPLVQGVVLAHEAAVGERQRHCQLNEMALKKLPLVCRLSALRGLYLPLPARKPLVRELSFPLCRESCALSVIS